MLQLDHSFYRMQKLILIDFENIQQLDFSGIDEHFHVAIFVGANQKKIPIDLVEAAQSLGSRLEWIRVDATGCNALDFFIACHLGRLMEKQQRPKCYVISRDKGFDPLLRYLNNQGLKCCRLDDLRQLNVHQAVPNENFERVLALLRKSQKQSRPRKIKTLSQHISSMFQKKLTQHEIDGIIKMMLAKKQISQSGESITYNF